MQKEEDEEEVISFKTVVELKRFSLMFQRERVNYYLRRNGTSSLPLSGDSYS